MTVSSRLCSRSFKIDVDDQCLICSLAHGPVNGFLCGITVCGGGKAAIESDFLLGVEGVVMLGEIVMQH